MKKYVHALTYIIVLFAVSTHCVGQDSKDDRLFSRDSSNDCKVSIYCYCTGPTDVAARIIVSWTMDTIIFTDSPGSANLYVEWVNLGGYVNDKIILGTCSMAPDPDNPNRWVGAIIGINNHPDVSWTPLMREWTGAHEGAHMFGFVHDESNCLMNEKWPGTSCTSDEWPLQDMRTVVGNMYPAEVICSNPYAECVDAVIDRSGQVSWRAPVQYCTEEYAVQELAGSRRWVDIGRVAADEKAKYSIHVDDSNRPMRIVEKDTKGVSRVVGDVVRVPHGMGDGLRKETMERHVPKKELPEELFGRGGSAPEKNGEKAIRNRLTIFFPWKEVLASDPIEVQEEATEWNNLAVPLRWYYELQTQFYDARLYPVSVGDCRDDIKQMIAQEYPGRVYYLLVGDANDWEYFADDGPERWANWVSPEWSNLRDQLISNDGYPSMGEREKNLIPTYMVHSEGLPYENMASFYPYYFSDQLYGDVDGDGVSDVYIARWPVNTADELVGLMNKSACYNQRESNGMMDIVSFVGDTETVVGSGDGAAHRRIAEYIVEGVSASHNMYSLLRSDIIDAGLYPLKESVAKWNVCQPDVAVVAASGSNRLRVGKMFEAGLWNYQYQVHSTGVVLAATCATADFASTGPPDSNPVCERMLLEDNGAVAWVGPTAGTWAPANKDIARRILDKWDTNRNDTLVKSFYDAISEYIDQNADHPDLVDVAKSYVYLGDPATRPCRKDYDVLGWEYVRVPRNCTEGKVAWRTSGEAECVLLYGERAVGLVNWSETMSGTEHEVDVGNLEPSTEYVGQITVLDGGEDVVDISWRTADCESPPDVEVSLSPNPFNPTISIAYGISEPVNVTIRVYDMRGREIRELFKGVKGAGNYRELWDGRGDAGNSMAAGTYIVEIRRGEKAETRKITLAK